MGLVTPLTMDVHLSMELFKILYTVTVSPTHYLSFLFLFRSVFIPLETIRHRILPRTTLRLSSSLRSIYTSRCPSSTFLDFYNGTQPKMSENRVPYISFSTQVRSSPTELSSLSFLTSFRSLNH